MILFIFAKALSGIVNILFILKISFCSIYPVAKLFVSTADMHYTFIGI